MSDMEKVLLHLNSGVGI